MRAGTCKCHFPSRYLKSFTQPHARSVRAVFLSVPLVRVPGSITYISDTSVCAKNKKKHTHTPQNRPRTQAHFCADPQQCRTPHPVAVDGDSSGTDGDAARCVCVRASHAPIGLCSSTSRRAHSAILGIQVGHSGARSLGVISYRF